MNQTPLSQLETITTNLRTLDNKIGVAIQISTGFVKQELLVSTDSAVWMMNGMEITIFECNVHTWKTLTLEKQEM